VNPRKQPYLFQKKKKRKQPYRISNQRLRDLGMEFTPAAQALYETVICFQEKGILPVPATATPSPSSLP